MWCMCGDLLFRWRAFQPGGWRCARRAQCPCPTTCIISRCCIPQTRRRAAAVEVELEEVRVVLRIVLRIVQRVKSLVQPGTEY